jgi:hypothetical protein
MWLFIAANPSNQRNRGRRHCCMQKKKRALEKQVNLENKTTSIWRAVFILFFILFFYTCRQNVMLVLAEEVSRLTSLYPALQAHLHPTLGLPSMPPVGFITSLEDTDPSKL